LLKKLRDKRVRHHSAVRLIFRSPKFAAMSERITLNEREGLEMRGPLVVAAVLALGWYVDQTMFYGHYFNALTGMLANIGHHSR